MHDDIFEIIAKHSAVKQRELVTHVQRAFRESVQEEVTPGPHVAPLARHVYYLAAAIDEEDRKGKPRDLGPAWTGAARFCDRAIKMLTELPESQFEPAKISSLAYHANNRQGSRSEGFYFWVLAGLWLAQKEGHFRDRYFLSLCPKDELAFLSSCADFCCHFLEDLNEEEAIAAPAGQNVSTREGIVELVLRHRPERLEVFEQYFKDHISVAKQGLHLMVYRPRLAEPSTFMKSFLAINLKPDRQQQGRPGNYQFKHIYSPPKKKSGERRLSAGKMVALDKGLYLIGEQRPMKHARGIGSNLLVFCFPWASLEAHEKEFTGLAMLANHSGIPLISRVAVRVTSISHSRHTHLGDVNFAGLPGDILNDQVQELEFLAGEGMYDDSNRPNEHDVAARIRSLCNNAPAKHEVPPGFRRTDKHQEPMQDITVESEIAKAFGSVDAAKWVCGEEIFDFWETLRFPPLA